MQLLSPAAIAARSLTFAKRNIELCAFNVLAAHLALEDAKTSIETHAAHTTIRLAEQRLTHAQRKASFELRAG